MTTTVLLLAFIIALFGLLTWRIMELENEVTDLRERLDVLDKPCE